MWRGMGLAPYAGTKDVETQDSGTAAHEAAVCARRTAEASPVRCELPLTGPHMGEAKPSHKGLQVNLWIFDIRRGAMAHQVDHLQILRGGSMAFPTGKKKGLAVLPVLFGVSRSGLSNKNSRPLFFLSFSHAENF